VGIYSLIVKWVAQIERLDIVVVSTLKVRP